MGYIYPRNGVTQEGRGSVSQEDVSAPCCLHLIPTTCGMDVVTTLPQLGKLRHDGCSTDAMLHLEATQVSFGAGKNTRWGWVTLFPQDTSVSAHLTDYLCHLVNWQPPSLKPRGILKVNHTASYSTSAWERTGSQCLCDCLGLREPGCCQAGNID